MRITVECVADHRGGHPGPQENQIVSIETHDVSRTPVSRRGPLAGIRVTDFCWMGVGAVATRMLASS